MTTSQDMIRGRSNVVTLTNNSGGALVAGDVCIQDTTADEKATTTTTASDTKKVFIAAESIASGAAGRFYESGYCPLVNVNASVTRGHFLFTHTVAKQATGSATYAAGAFGKILKTSATPSAIIYSQTAQISSGVGGSSGSTDNAVIRADGTGGSTVQSSAATIDDNGTVNIPTGQTYNINNTPHTHAGSSGAQILPLDIAPGSPSAYDDEFPGSSLDVKWTSPITSNTGSGVTTTVSNSWLTMEPTTAGTSSTGLRVFGIRQNSPAVSFTVMCKMFDAGNLLAGVNTDDGRSGIWVAKSGGGYAWVLGRQNSVPRVANLTGVTTYSESADWSSFNGTDVHQDVIGDVNLGHWYKLVYDASGSTLTAYWSSDGVNWYQLSQQSSVTQPDRMGVCTYGNTANILANHTSMFDWFRVTTP